MNILGHFTPIDYQYDKAAKRLCHEYLPDDDIFFLDRGPLISLSKSNFKWNFISIKFYFNLQCT